MAHLRTEIYAWVNEEWFQTGTESKLCLFPEHPGIASQGRLSRQSSHRRILAPASVWQVELFQSRDAVETRKICEDSVEIIRAF